MLKIDVSSNSKEFSKLSPHKLGPIALMHNKYALNLERAWQYLQVYSEHVGVLNIPTEEWLKWSDEGCTSEIPPIIPAGEPLFFYYNLESLSFKEGIRKFYIPQYEKYAYRTAAFHELAHQYWKNFRQIELDDNGEGHGPILMEMLRKS